MRFDFRSSQRVPHPSLNVPNTPLHRVRTLTATHTLTPLYSSERPLTVLYSNGTYLK